MTEGRSDFAFPAARQVELVGIPLKLRRNYGIMRLEVHRSVSVKCMGKTRITQRVTWPPRECRVHLKSEVGYEIFAGIHDLFAHRRSLDRVGRIGCCAEGGIGFRDN